jgi:hypothetical protein
LGKGQSGESSEGRRRLRIQVTGYRPSPPGTGSLMPKVCEKIGLVRQFAACCRCNRTTQIATTAITARIVAICVAA